VIGREDLCEPTFDAALPYGLHAALPCGLHGAAASVADDPTPCGDRRALSIRRDPSVRHLCVKIGA